MNQILASFLDEKIDLKLRKNNVTAFIASGLKLNVTPLVSEIVEQFKRSNEIVSKEYLKNKFLDEAEILPFLEAGFFKTDFDAYLQTKKEEEVSSLEQLYILEISKLQIQKKYEEADEVYQKIRALRSNNKSFIPYKPTSLVSGKDYYKELKNVEIGLQTFIEPIDKMTGGIPKGSVVTVAGFVGHLKSSFLYNIFYNNIILKKRNGVLLSLEADDVKVKHFLLGRHSTTLDKWIKTADIMHGTLTAEDEAYLFEIVEKDLDKYLEHSVILNPNNFLNGEITFESFKQKLIEIDNEMPLDFVLIDYLQLLYFHCNDEPKQRHMVNQFMRNLKANLALNFNGKRIAVVVAAQINRESFKQKKYTLASVASNNEAERSSDILITLYKDEIVLKEMGCITMQLLKNRYGACIETAFNVGTILEYGKIGGDLKPDISMDDFDQLISNG